MGEVAINISSIQKQAENRRNIFVSPFPHSFFRLSLTGFLLHSLLLSFVKEGLCAKESVFIARI
jgi:hypothetical protein